MEILRKRTITAILAILCALVLPITFEWQSTAFAVGEEEGGQDPVPEDPVVEEPVVVEKPSIPVIVFEKKTTRAVYFHWNCKSGAEKYKIYVSKNGGDSYHLLKTTTKTTCVYGSAYDTIPGKT